MIIERLKEKKRDKKKKKEKKKKKKKKGKKEKWGHLMENQQSPNMPLYCRVKLAPGEYGLKYMHRSGLE